MESEDEVFTQQLRHEDFGPWPDLRKLLSREGVDPESVTVRKISDGGHGSGTADGELFEFFGPGGTCYNARVRFHYPHGQGTISHWRQGLSEVTRQESWYWSRKHRT